MTAIIFTTALNLLIGCSDETPNPADGSEVPQGDNTDEWSAWTPDCLLPNIPFADASNQYVVQLPVGPVVEYEQYIFEDAYSRDTMNYVKWTYDSHTNVTVRMSYVLHTNVPDKDLYYYTYNSDGIVAVLSCANQIDNSVNGNPQLYCDYGPTT